MKPTEHNQIVSLFTKAIEHDAKDAAAHYGRGLLYAAVDEPQHAIADYTRRSRSIRRMSRPTLPAERLTALNVLTIRAR